MEQSLDGLQIHAAWKVQQRLLAHALRLGMAEEWTPSEDMSTAWSRRVAHETFF
ncbi:unnamed protein product [Chondrus crispus]|uniref:Uncharacterized protein n=1 Tax=Chondrus crispus TaxID=2769 RepID=R7QRQ6_CHOCR|nr:unnamed protein product [Chondrus crispus]CDF40186.1 unnamed protein product [Chondrus crispus]|eukprot:XP_005710480.1 unnamed protein product [Chondrus crispus]